MDCSPARRIVVRQCPRASSLRPACARNSARSHGWRRRQKRRRRHFNASSSTLSRVIAALAITAGILVFVIGEALGMSRWTNFVFAIGIIVANVPEGLLPTVTLAMAMGSRRMARRNVLVRRLTSIETLGAATVICTDKTGTLTENRMTARTIYSHGRLDGSERTERARRESELTRFLECARRCHDLKDTGHTDGTLDRRSDGDRPRRHVRAVDSGRRTEDR